MGNHVVHHGSLYSLYAFAYQQCLICTDIQSKIESTYPELDVDLFSDYRIECCWMRLSEPRGKQKMWFVMVNPSVDTDPFWNWQPVLELALWPSADFGHHFTNEDIAVRNIPIRGHWDDCANDGTNDCLATRGLSLGLLERCKQNADGQHALCSRQDRRFLPTRLLDVRQALQKGTVCLVHPMEQPGLFEGENSRNYVTLSHCWGLWGAKNSPMLLAANLSTRQNEGLMWDLLPQTFQDAFKIASWFGWDWLWIDSLCIIQDSLSDWKTEAAMMDQVYLNAQITISADMGEDSRAGCFSQRRLHDLMPLKLSSLEAKSPWVVITESAFGWMHSANSLSRAWIHRERQLSRRILHFTEKGLVWECCGLGKAGFASETMPGGAPFDRVFNGDTKFQVEWSEADDPSEHSAEDRVINIHRLWNSTCESLSRKSVTYATDMPVILSSVAKEMHRMIPNDEYACGLWRSTMPESLAWWLEGVKPEGIGFIAPSWSWLSVANPVKMALQNRHQNKLPVAEVLDVKVELDSADPYGAVTKGDLRMSGYLRRLHFHYVDNGRFIISVIEEDDNGDDRLRLIGPDWSEYGGHLCKLTLDATLRLDYQEHECYAFFTTIAERGQDVLTCNRELTCLLLDAVVGRNDTYKRIGTLGNLSDEYSFKMRYRVSPRVSNAEAGSSRSSHIENAIGYEGPPTSKNQQMKRSANLPASIWDLLAGLIRRNRWLAIDEYKKEKGRLRKEAEDKESNSSDNAHDSQADEELGEEDSDQAYSPASDADIPGLGRASSKAEPVFDSNDGSRSEEDSRDAEQAEEINTHSGHDAVNNLQHISYRSLIGQIRKHPSCGIQTLADEHEERQMVEYAARMMPETKAYGSESPPSETLYQFDDVLDKTKYELGVVSWLERLDLVEVTMV